MTRIRIAYNQIIEKVVKFIAIKMMCYFAFFKCAVKFRFKNYNMLKNISFTICSWMVWKKDFFVSLFNYKRLGLVFKVVLVATIIIFGSVQYGRGNMDSNPTVCASRIVCSFSPDSLALNRAEISIFSIATSAMKGESNFADITLYHINMIAQKGLYVNSRFKDGNHYELKGEL